MAIGRCFNLAWEERRQIALAYDAVPVHTPGRIWCLGFHRASSELLLFQGLEVAWSTTAYWIKLTQVFSLLLQGEEEEKPVAVQFWIAADPVTTVEEPGAVDILIRQSKTSFWSCNFWLLRLEDPSKQEIAENHVWLDDFDISPGSDGFTRAISEPCESDINKAVRLYKSSEHIHTVDADGAPADTPLHVYAARSRGHTFKTPLVSKNPGLPTKVWPLLLYLKSWVFFLNICWKYWNDLNKCFF